MDADRLPPETSEELKRLGPDGNTYDSGIQAYLAGPISERVEREVREKLGFKTRAFRFDDPFALSEELDTWAAAVHGDRPDEVIIVQYDQLSTGLPRVSWNPHMGHGLFFVKGEWVPEATRRVPPTVYVTNHSSTCSAIHLSSLRACFKSSIKLVERASAGSW